MGTVYSRQVRYTVVDTGTGDLPGHLPTTSVVKLDNQTAVENEPLVPP